MKVGSHSQNSYNGKFLWEVQGRQDYTHAYDTRIKTMSTMTPQLHFGNQTLNKNYDTFFGTDCNGGQY